MLTGKVLTEPRRSLKTKRRMNRRKAQINIHEQHVPINILAMLTDRLAATKDFLHRALHWLP